MAVRVDEAGHDPQVATERAGGCGARERDLSVDDPEIHGLALRQHRAVQVERLVDDQPVASVRMGAAVVAVRVDEATQQLVGVEGAGHGAILSGLTVADYDRGPLFFGVRNCCISGGSWKSFIAAASSASVVGIFPLPKTLGSGTLASTSGASFGWLRLAGLPETPRPFFLDAGAVRPFLAPGPAPVSMPPIDCIILRASTKRFTRLLTSLT